MRKTRQYRQGLTLIELLVALAIVGVLGVGLTQLIQVITLEAESSGQRQELLLSSRLALERIVASTLR